MRHQSHSQGSGLDPVLFSVIVSRLDSIAAEMTIALERAAMSSILGLCRDYSCCLYDRAARQIAMVDALPIHTNTMHLVLGRIAEQYGDDLAEGDVIACNYAYSANTHIGDLVTVCPVFYEGEHLFWAAAKGHQLDVGAPVPSSSNPWARNVWQEGLQIPPVKFYEGGTQRRDVVELYLTNMRFRDSLSGDLMAQLGSIWTAQRRLHEMCEEFGAKTVQTYVDESIAYADRRTRAAIREMPNGVYTGEGWLDSDGLERHNVPIRCTVTINDESVDVDFAGSAPQVETGLNSSYAVMQAAGGIPIVMAIDPDIPRNEGCLRRVTVSAPLGSICNAEYPAATTTATTMPADLMQDVVCRALMKAIPDRMRAGSAHWSNSPMVAGRDPESEEDWGHLLLNGGSGGGASAGADGWPLMTTNAAQGGLKTASIEQTELLYPIRFEECAIESGSAGLGEHIGGPGVRCTIRPVGASLDLIYSNDGLENPPFGALGGTAGRGGGSYIAGERRQRRFLPAVGHVTVGASETWTAVSTGGGGYGHPVDRPVDRVRDDVRDGMYSRAVAEQVLGVVLSPAPELTVDEPATIKARAELARRDGAPPPVLPVTPGASRWLEDTMRPGDVMLGGVAVRP